MKSNAHPVMVGAVLGLCITTAATARSAAEVQLAQQRFESTAKAQLKVLAQQNAKSGKSEKTESAKEVLDSMRFVFERSVLPDVRNERQFGEIRVVVTDGWMALAEHMIRASVALEHHLLCLEAYERTALMTAQHNRAEAVKHNKPDLNAIPRLPDFVASHQELASKRNACKGVKASTLVTPSVDKKVVAGMDAMLVWLIARQAALHMEAAQASPICTAKASGEANAFCPDLEADQRAVAYAQAVRVDMRPAQEAMLAHAVLFTSESVHREDCTSQRLSVLVLDMDKKKAEFIKTLGPKSTK